MKNYSKYTLERIRIPIDGSYREGYATIDGIKQWIFITDIEKTNKHCMSSWKDKNNSCLYGSYLLSLIHIT